MTGKPIAPKGEYCPLWRRDVSKVCHTCTWYSHIEGVHPQTGDRMDKWQCAIALQVTATLEAARAATVGAATTQELRNDMHSDRKQQTRLLASRPISDSALIPFPQPPRQLGFDDGQ